VAVRYLLMSTHYRQRLNFTLDCLEAAKNSVTRINDFVFNLKNVKRKENNKKVDVLIKKAKERFESAMDNDIGIPEALASVFDFVRDINKENISKSDAKEVIALMKGFDKVLGILKQDEKVPEGIKKLVGQREKARKEKDWDKADKIREEIKKKGFGVEDSDTGARIKKLNG
jgi:cysteinyl-tRNA synthetase